MSIIKLCTFNARGLNEKKKRRDIFTWLKRKNIDICMIQETHSTVTFEPYWEAEWGYKSLFSSHDGKSRGVCILIKNSFSYVIKKTITDPNGRFLITNMLLNEMNVTIVNLYGPNNDDPVFFQGVKSKLEEFDNSQIILGGDYNVVQDYILDVSNIQNRNNPKSHDMVEKIKEDLDLIDPWRTKFPEEKIFTWHNSRNQQSRLDYFLISSELMHNVETIVIKPGYRSDHSIVEMSIKINQHKKGPGLWKFNNALILDHEYVNQIKTCITETIHQYKDQNEPDTYPNEQKYTISDQILFEVIKLEVRGKTIAYSSAKKKEHDKTEKRTR